jgi:anti-sigma B factor antagonist
MRAPAGISQRTADPGFACDVAHVDGITIVTVEGELDLSTAATLCGEIEATFRDPGARVLVDLSPLEFCDSTGLRALVGVVNEARVHGVPLVIAEPTVAAAARALQIAGGVEFLPLVSARDEGLATLDRSR